jgi:nucleotide-binding universal stress UspA family protein
MASKRARFRRQILCPIDFSEPSRRALRYAAAFAAHAEASLNVLFVNDPLLSTAAAAAGYDEDRLRARSERELRRFVAHSLGTRGAAARVQYLLAMGDPSREIGRHVREQRAGLVVMGTHGLRGPRKLLLGSTTERMLRSATVPVLAVPHGASRQPPRGWPAGPLMAGVDLGREAAGDVRIVAALAQGLESELLLVHVQPDVNAPAWLPVRRAEDDAAARARGKLASLAALAGVPGVSVQFRVLSGDPAAALARVARTARAGTLVLTLRRGKGLFGMARGTVTYRVLTTAVTPVLALPAGAAATRFVRAWAEG